MILGIGDDMCDIRRIEALLQRFGERFLARVFTATERATVDRVKTARARAGALAKRFAAKEAMSKALGTGLARDVRPLDLGVVTLPSGRPTLRLAGAAALRLAALAPVGMEARAHLTMTDEYPYAIARVLLEAVSAVNSRDGSAL